MISHDEIQAKTFPVSFRGYNQEEVDEFLDKLSEDVDKLNEECKLLRKKISALTMENQKYQIEEEESEQRRRCAEEAAEAMKAEAELSLKNAVLEAEETVTSATKKADEILSGTRDESTKIIKKAEAEAEEAIENAKASAAETISAAKAYCKSRHAEAEAEAEKMIKNAELKAEEIKRAASQQAYLLVSDAAEKSNSLVVTARTEAAKLRSSADYHVATCHQRYLIMSELISKVRTKTTDIINTALKDIDTLADELKTDSFSSFIKNEDNVEISYPAKSDKDNPEASGKSAEMINIEEIPSEKKASEKAGPEKIPPETSAKNSGNKGEEVDIISQEDIYKKLAKIIDDFKDDQSQNTVREMGEEKDEDFYTENEADAPKYIDELFVEKRDEDYDDYDFDSAKDKSSAEDTVTAQYETLPSTNNAGDIDVIYGSFNLEEIISDDKF